MVVLSVTECPPALRGDISCWLQEIDTGVYVGKVSQRVREEIWKRVVDHIKIGRAILVYTANNEQGMDFRIHGSVWEPIDFDGIKLMLQPNEERKRLKTALNITSKRAAEGYSTAAKTAVAKRMQRARDSNIALPEHFIVMDLETTGLDPKRHRILELGAIEVAQGSPKERFHALILQEAPLSAEVRSLTGLTEEDLVSHGRELRTVLPAFLEFLGDSLLVGHNLSFDLDFLYAACAEHDVMLPRNRRIDTLMLARRLVSDAPGYQLAALTQHFGLSHHHPHRSLSDCEATLSLLNKLIEIRNNRR